MNNVLKCVYVCSIFDQLSAPILILIIIQLSIVKNAKKMFLAVNAHTHLPFRFFFAVIRSVLDLPAPKSFLPSMKPV